VDVCLSIRSGVLHKVLPSDGVFSEEVTFDVLLKGFTLRTAAIVHKSCYN